MAKYIKQAERARRDLNDRVAQLTAANIENKKAAMINARAKSRDVDQQMGLQQNRQQAIISLQGMKGGQGRANTLLSGQNAMNLAAERGLQARKTNSAQNAFTLGQDEQKNTWSKEKDNRAFVTGAMTRGATMDAQAQNAYNTPGSQNVDITGMQVPQKAPVQQKSTYVQPQFDKDGGQRPGTGLWATPPAQQGEGTGLSKDFNPASPSPEDEAYLRNLAATGQFELLRQLEAQYGL